MRTDRIHITGMQREYESVQLLLLASKQVRVQVESTLPFALKWYQVGYVNVRPNKRVANSGGGWRPDPLIEMLPGGPGVFVPRDFGQPLWLTWYLAADGATNATGEVIVRVDGKVAHRIPVTARVGRLVTPSVFDAKVKQAWGFTEKNLEPLYGKPVPRDIVRKFKDLLYDHRIPAPAETGDFAARRAPIIIVNLPYVVSSKASFSSLSLIPVGGQLPACGPSAKLDTVLMAKAVAELKREVEGLLAL